MRIIKKIKILLAIVALLAATSTFAADICGKVVRGGGTDPGYNSMQRHRYVYYMTTEDIDGEHWATILVSAYPNSDPAINVQIAGFYLRVMPGSTDNTNPVDGRAGEWGFLTNPSIEKYYDQATKSIEINGASMDDWDDLIKLEYLDVTYEGYATPVKAIRIKFKYRNQLSKFRFAYRSISKRCETDTQTIESYEVTYNGGTGISELEELSLDGSCRDIINAANPVLTIEGETFNAAAPTNLIYNAVDETEEISGIYKNLIAATTFSSKTTATHYSAEQVEWFDKTNSVKMEVFYPEAYANGTFMEQEKGYAIVSNPKVLDGKLESRDDNVNRLIFNLPSYNNDNGDPMVSFELGDMPDGTTLTMLADWEYVSPDCWTCNCSTCDPIVKENSCIRGYSSFGDKNIDEFNRRDRKGTMQFSGTIIGHKFFWKPTVRNSRDCDVIAFSNIRFFGATNKYIDKDIETQADCEGTIVTLTAKGIGDEDGYTWYERIDDGEFNVIAGQTKRKLQVELDLHHHAYYATNGDEEVEPIELQGLVCCESTTKNFKTLWKEDFGTITPGTVRPFPTSDTDQFRAKIVKHNYAAPGTCCYDGYYRVVSSVKDANMVDPGYSGSEYCNGWNMTPAQDHTGNENGGFLLINTGAELNAQMLELDVKGPFCANTWYNFSMWATQVSKQNEYPCSIVIEIHEITKIGGSTKKLLGRVATGNMTVFEMERWINYALSIQPEETTEAIRVKVFNEGLIGNGNDIAIDDIQFTTCAPVVRMVTENGTDEITKECGKETKLEIAFDGKETTYFPTGAWILWQHSLDGGDSWANLEEPSKGAYNFTTVANTTTATLYRAVVANTKEVVLAIGAGKTSPDCETYTITNYNSVTCDGGCDIPASPETSDNFYCKGDAITSISITSEIPTGATVAWYDSQMHGTQLSDAVTFTPTQPGTYYAEIIDNTGFCKSVRTATTLLEVELPVTTIKGNLEGCPGSTVTLNALAQSGEKPFTYEWSDYKTGTGSTIKITLPDYATNVGITLTTTDKYGCIGKIDTILKVNDGLRPDVPVTTDNSFCTGTAPTELSASAVLGTSQEIEWFESETSDTPLATGITFIANGAGTYYAQVTDSRTNCTSERVEATLTEVTPVSSVAFINEPDEIRLGDDSDPAVIITPADAPYTEQWSVNGTVIDPDTYFPHIPYIDQVYTVKVTDECANTFELESKLNVIWPTVFTPYSVDGYNDDFVVDMDQPFHIMVLDRYGDKVYEGDNGWPTDAAASKLPGVYYYVVTLPDGTLKRGSVEIYR